MTMMDKCPRARRAKKAVVRVARLAMAGAMLTCAFNAYAVDAPTSRTLDDFSQPSRWKASGTDDISASLRPVDGKDAHDKNGRALCLDFDFHGVSGGVTLHRALPINFPANYALSFDVRGAMPANDLQLRLIDASGVSRRWLKHSSPLPPWPA
jgi:hypothetical protein